MNLLDETLLLLQNRRHLTLRQVSSKSGLKLDWLSKFVNGKIPDPGIKKVIKLHEFLIKESV